MYWQVYIYLYIIYLIKVLYNAFNIYYTCMSRRSSLFRTSIRGHMNALVNKHVMLDARVHAEVEKCLLQKTEEYNAAYIIRAQMRKRPECYYYYVCCVLLVTRNNITSVIRAWEDVAKNRQCIIVLFRNRRRSA